MKKHRRLLAMLLIVVTVFTMAAPVGATDQEDGISPQASYYINAVRASATGGTGKITVSFSITATGPMTSLGATTVSIRDSSGTLVKTFTSDTTSGMMGSNQTYYSSSVTYNGAVSGKKYYATVYYKAANSSGSDTTSYTTAYATAK